MNDTHSQATAFLEKQLEAERPNLDPDMRRSLASIGAHLAERSAEEAKAMRNPPEPKKEPAKVIQLQFWGEDYRAAPNAVFRSALFPALRSNEKENRLYLEQEEIYCVAGLKILFTGKQFDQSDLDVYLEILNMARHFPLGTPVKFSAYALLKALGLPVGGSNHARLHAVLIRLRGGTLDVTDHKFAILAD